MVIESRGNEFCVNCTWSTTGGDAWVPIRHLLFRASTNIFFVVIDLNLRRVLWCHFMGSTYKQRDWTLPSISLWTYWFNYDYGATLWHSSLSVLFGSIKLPMQFHRIFLFTASRTLFCYTSTPVFLVFFFLPIVYLLQVCQSEMAASIFDFVSVCMCV